MEQYNRVDRVLFVMVCFMKTITIVHVQYYSDRFSLPSHINYWRTLCAIKTHPITGDRYFFSTVYTNYQRTCMLKEIRLNNGWSIFILSVFLYPVEVLPDIRF